MPFVVAVLLQHSESWKSATTCLCHRDVSHKDGSGWGDPRGQGDGASVTLGAASFHGFPCPCTSGGERAALLRCHCTGGPSARGQCPAGAEPPGVGVPWANRALNERPGGFLPAGAHPTSTIHAWVLSCSPAQGHFPQLTRSVPFPQLTHSEPFSLINSFRAIPPS